MGCSTIINSALLQPKSEWIALRENNQTDKGWHAVSISNNQCSDWTCGAQNGAHS